MTNKFDDMRDILVCFADAQEEGRGVTGFATKVNFLMGMSMSRKIQALCWLLDNQLNSVASLGTAVSIQSAYLEHYGFQNEDIDADDLPAPMTKEDAFAALQMAITAQAVNYQNGDNK